MTHFFCGYNLGFDLYKHKGIVMEIKRNKLLDNCKFGLI